MNLEKETLPQSPFPIPQIVSLSVSTRVALSCGPKFGFGLVFVDCPFPRKVMGIFQSHSLYFSKKARLYPYRTSSSILIIYRKELENWLGFLKEISLNSFRKLWSFKHNKINMNQFIL